jgi:hypothetical protein
MGHGVHGVVGTMDPHADGHVMAGYENLVTWVHFASCPSRGMLQEPSWGWEDGQGEGVGAKHVLAGTFVRDAFISFGLFNVFPHTAPHPEHRSLR